MRSGAALGMALLLWATAASAQGLQPEPAQLAALRKLDLWVGEWSGSGWAVSASGKRTEFSLTENVQRRLGGTVLLVEGKGTSLDGSVPQVVTHDGLVVVSYDEKAGRYHWSGHELGSGAIEAEPTLIDGGFEWSIPAAGGSTVRIRILLDERTWHEVGEVSADGKPWIRFMEVTLQRQ